MALSIVGSHASLMLMHEYVIVFNFCTQDLGIIKHICTLIDIKFILDIVADMTRTGCPQCTIHTCYIYAIYSFLSSAEVKHKYLSVFLGQFSVPLVDIYPDVCKCAKTLDHIVKIRELSARNSFPLIIFSVWLCIAEMCGACASVYRSMYVRVLIFLYVFI